MRIILSRTTIFKISYILILIKSIVYNSYISPENNLFLMTGVNYLALILLGIGVVWKTPRRFKYIMTTVCMFAIFLYIYQITKSTDLILWVLFIILSSNVEKESTLKSAFWTLLIGTLIIILLNLVGIIDQFEIIKNGNVVHSFGFIHPNGLATTVLRIILLYISLNYINMRFRKLVFIGLVYIILGELTGCRVASIILVVCLTLLAYDLLNKKALESTMSKLLMSSSPFLTAIFSFGGGYLFMSGNSIMLDINQFFSDRFNWISRYLQSYEITLFGQKLQLSNRTQGGEYWSSIDNSYVMMGLNYGFIFLIGYCAIMAILIYYYLKQKEKGKAITCFAFVLLGLTENQIFSVTANFMLLYAGDVIYGLLNMKNVAGTQVEKNHE